MPNPHILKLRAAAVIGIITTSSLEGSEHTVRHDAPTGSQRKLWLGKPFVRHRLNGMDYWSRNLSERGKPCRW